MAVHLDCGPAARSADSLEPPAATSEPIARANPAAKLLVALLMPLVLVLSVDVVTAGTAVALELLALPWCGVSARQLRERLRWVVLAALPAALLTAVFGGQDGTTVAGLGPVVVTSGSLVAGAAVMLRILAIALPGVVLVATTDPTDLADALAQVLRLPHRFVLSALAALRLLGILAQEWQVLTYARRARGLGGERGLARVRLVGGQVFALLVLAIRRATVLATAMESRGFGVQRRRTWSRPSRFDLGDLVLLAGGLGLAAIATAAGVLAGTWQLILA